MPPTERATAKIGDLRSHATPTPPWPCKLMSRAPPASLADASRSGLQGVIQGKRKHTAPSVKPNFPAAPPVQANHAGWQPSAEDTEAFVSAMGDGSASHQGDGSASHQGSSSVAASTSGAAWLRRVEEDEVQGEGAEGGGDDDDDEDIWDQNGDEDEDEDMWEDAVAATDDSLLPAGAGAVDVEIQVDEEPEVRLALTLTLTRTLTRTRTRNRTLTR